MGKTRMASRDTRTTFYQIIRATNSEADKMAYAAIGANPGALSIERFSSVAPLY